jgi:ABC-2 type transport system ATP-binding protein
MEEAERLCNRIAIIDAGKIIAEGTLDQLLEKLTYEESISILRNPTTMEKIEVFKQFGTLIDENDHYELKPKHGFQLSSFFTSIEQNGISYKFTEMHKPTLEALFLHLTGRRLRD